MERSCPSSSICSLRNIHSNLVIIRDCNRCESSAVSRISQLFQNIRPTAQIGVVLDTRTVVPSFVFFDRPFPTSETRPRISWAYLLVSELHRLSLLTTNPFGWTAKNRKWTLLSRKQRRSESFWFTSAVNLIPDAVLFPWIAIVGIPLTANDVTCKLLSSLRNRGCGIRTIERISNKEFWID